MNFLFLILAFTQILNAQSDDCSYVNQLPKLVEGCQGELCGLVSYPKAVSDVVLFKDASEKAKSVGKVKRCQKLDDMKAFTLLTKTGSGKVLSIKETTLAYKLGLREGDSLPLIFSYGEGFYRGCYKNKVITNIETMEDSAEISIQPIAAPEGDTWMQLKTSKGTLGFAKGQDFYLGHYNNDPLKYCGDDHPFGKNAKQITKDIGTRLSDAFSEVCGRVSPCENMDPTAPCPLEIEVWSRVSSIFPKNLQCAGFDLGKTACSKKWGGSFSCAYKRDGADQQLHTNFSCNGGKDVRCNLFDSYASKN